MIYVLTDVKHSGKTSFLKSLLKVRQRGFYGVLSEAFFEDGKRLGYDAVDIESGRSFLLSRKTEEKNWQKTKIYYLDPKGIKKASSIITRRKPNNYTLVIDEIGPLEVKHKKGLWEAIEAVFKTAENDIVVVVKKEVVEEFLEHIRNKPYQVIDNSKAY